MSTFLIIAWFVAIIVSYKASVVLLDKAKLL